MPRQNFYIPQWQMWNWKLISPVFVSLQLARSRSSYRETDDALAQLDKEVRNIEQEIRSVWMTANVQAMRAFQARLREVGIERRRIGFVRLKLRRAIDAMLEHFPQLDKTEEYARESFGRRSD